jgi:hypothetical protein
MIFSSLSAVFGLEEEREIPDAEDAKVTQKTQKRKYKNINTTAQTRYLNCVSVFLASFA